MFKDNKKIFYNLLANTLISSVTNTFVWFALTFWAFLSTKSVLVTSMIAGIFAVAHMLSAFFFGGIVDKHKKRTAMLVSNIVSLSFYILGGIILFSFPNEVFSNQFSFALWSLIVLLMIGTVAGNLRMIALSTVVTLLFKDNRDKANGMVGAVNGISFSLTSVFSGLVIGFFSMKIAIVIAIISSVISLIHLIFINFNEGKVEVKEDEVKKETNHFSFKENIAIISSIRGLFGLIFFATFNNFLGGVFMALMDAYGLSLVSVQTWGIMFAILSFGFIAGNTFIAKFGLGKNPLRNLLLANVIAWTSCIFFTIQPSVILLAIGIFIWMSIGPFAEASEQTVIQNVVPYEQQGRVFGFSQSVESAATPITTFLIGPIAQFIFIPFMTTGKGVDLIGSWFGVGEARGIALLFTICGIVGLLVTLLAFKSKSYKLLSKTYSEAKSA